MTNTPISERPPRMLKPSIFWDITSGIPQNLRWMLMAISIITPLVLWAVVSSQGWVKPLFLPSPMAVWQAIADLWGSGDLQKDIIYSVLRVLIGFILAVIVSIPLGIMMGTFGSIRALFEPIIGILRYMPAPAFIPLLVLYFGVGEIPKVLLIFIGTLFFNTLMIMDAVKFVPKELIEATYTLGGQRPQVVVKVIFPYILPKIIDACRVNIAASWNLVIVSELVAATEGLGRRISVAQRFLNTDQIFAGLIVIGLIGLLIDLCFIWLQRFLCRWSID
jgi:NitT/TauT family transport system permease protein